MKYCTLLLLLTLAAGLAACSGVNTIRVVSEPPGAQLTVNGKAMGPTPQEVPQKWWWWPPFFVTGDPLEIMLAKPGYAPVKDDITYADVHMRWMVFDREKGSRFGQGNTFTYKFQLPPK